MERTEGRKDETIDGAFELLLSEFEIWHVEMFWFSPPSQAVRPELIGFGYSV